VCVCVCVQVQRMNLELLNPFSELPEVIEDYLEHGAATCCSPNRRGTLLAVGTADGQVVIWDFDTRGIARSLKGHIYTVSSVSWSRNGRKLLSGSYDCTVKLWDVLTGNIEHSLQLEKAIIFCQIHPRDPNRYLIIPYNQRPFIGNWATGETRVLPHHSDEQGDKQDSKKQKVQITAASFNKMGDKIYTGDGNGFISIVDSDTLEIKHTFRVTGGHAIKSIRFSKSGKDFLINSDRTLRAYDVDTLQPMVFQDAVNRIQWRQCCFSCDGDFIVGGSAEKTDHNIYVWNRAFGGLVKILEGPKEGIIDLMWHPLRPIIVSISAYGRVYIWATNYAENWSAFAPDFTELQENEEYEEREDEFDIPEDEEQGQAKKRKRIDDPGNVDITAVDKIAAYSSGEEDELWFIPIVLEDTSAPPTEQPATDSAAAAAAAGAVTAMPTETVVPAATTGEVAPTTEAITPAALGTATITPAETAPAPMVAALPANTTEQAAQPSIPPLGI